MSLTLIKRHLKIFMKKPGNVFLSLLSSVVILSLYFLFIRDFTIKAVSDYGFVSDMNDLFVDRLMTSGLLVVIGATSVLSIVSIFINDKCKGILKDFYVTAISKINIIYTYIISSIVVSTLLTLLVYFFVELFFKIYYDYFSITEIIGTCQMIILSNIISSNLIFIIAIFINNITSFSTFETLYGVIIGFFTGVYIPIGYYPVIIKDIFFFFPLTQTTSILRQINTNQITTNILSSYQDGVHHILYEIFGIHLKFNNFELTLNHQFIFIFLTIVILQVITFVLIEYDS